jgi:hypothetical protein
MVEPFPFPARFFRETDRFAVGSASGGHIFGLGH